MRAKPGAYNKELKRLLSRRYEKTHEKTDPSSQKTDFPIVVTCLDGLGWFGGRGKTRCIDVRRVFII